MQVSTPCRGITCAEVEGSNKGEEEFVSTPCRGITCAEQLDPNEVLLVAFPPPVGESPVLSINRKYFNINYKFPPPVGESPVLRI